MSASSKQTPILTVESALGVEVRILDGRLSEVARSDTQLRKELKPGIYTVRWTAGETTGQKVVRLREGDDLTLGLDNLVPGSGPSEDMGLAARQFDALAAIFSSQRARRLTIFVCSNDERTTSDVGSNVELRHAPSSQLNRSGTVEPNRQLSERDDGWSAAHYDCDAGLYTLRYLSSDRVTVEQTLFVPEGRHTVVWLRYGSALTPEHRESGDVKYRARRGIDPARSRIVSLASSDDPNCLRERFLLCDHLVEALVLRRGEVKSSVIDGVKRQHDPLIKLLAAASLLTRPNSPDADWVERVENPMAAPSVNVAAARDVMADLRGQAMHDWPDTACIDWRSALAEGRRDSNFPAIYAPPMLEVAWRWAAAWSVVDPYSVDPSRDRSLWAVTKGQERSTPWLSWRVTDLRSKGLPATDVSTSPNLSEIGVSLIGELSAKISVGLAARARFDLSEQTRDLLETASRVANRETWDRAGQDLLSRLAGATGLPVATLVDAALVALKELSGTSSPTTEADILASDPNKGMFGGKSRRDGIKVFLVDFGPTNSPEFLALRFEVRGGKKRPLSGPVKLFLHPTFNPPTLVVAPVDGVATYTCYAWGGFTLGVELATGERLELDIAEDERLPENFRNR